MDILAPVLVASLTVLLAMLLFAVILLEEQCVHFTFPQRSLLL